MLVDTIVTGKQGEYIHDLTAKDFRVWEDNKEQAIKSVALEKAQTAAPRQRYLVLFFAGMEARTGLPPGRLSRVSSMPTCEENRPMAVVEFQRRDADRPELHR